MKKIAKKIAATAIAAAVIATASCSNTTDSSENNKTQTPGSPVITDTDGDGVPDILISPIILADIHFEKNVEWISEGYWDIGVWASLGNAQNYSNFRGFVITPTLPEEITEIEDPYEKKKYEKQIKISNWFDTKYKKFLAGRHINITYDEKLKNKCVTFEIKAVDSDGNPLASAQCTLPMTMDSDRGTFTEEMYTYLISSDNEWATMKMLSEGTGCPCHEESEEVCGCEDYCIIKFPESEEAQPICLCDHCQHTK